MSDQKSSFGTGSEPYTTTVSFGGPAPARQGAAEAVKDVTTASFAADVVQESRNRPVLVDFWAPWCGPCKQLAPLIEKVVAEAGGAVRLVKMNIDEHPGVAGQLGIQSIPAVIAFRDGQPVDGFVGAVPESQIRDLIKRLGADPVQNDIGDALAAAQEAVEAGDGDTARKIYEMVLGAAPDNAEAVIGLAGLDVDEGRLDAAEAALLALPPGPKQPQEAAGLLARIAVLRETAKLGDAGEIQARLTADPSDHQARFDLALLQNAGGDRHGAAESLLAIVRADRTWQDDGARNQLLKFFEAWGMADEATLAARRKLSSLLFS